MTVTTAHGNLVMEQLVALSRELGCPEHELAILGEGNSSALHRCGSFWVKASGATLHGIDADGFVLLAHAGTLALLDRDLDSDEAILQALKEATLGDTPRRPSIEAMLHALLLNIPGIRFVGHTHPVPVNAVLCSMRAEELVTQCYFPDQIVCCGPRPVFIPYADPGLPLARLVRDRVHAWMDSYGMAPRAVLLQNHGLFATGSTPHEVLSCTLMWAKMARVDPGRDGLRRRPPHDRRTCQPHLHPPGRKIPPANDRGEIDHAGILHHRGTEARRHRELFFILSVSPCLCASVFKNPNRSQPMSSKVMNHYDAVADELCANGIQAEFVQESVRALAVETPSWGYGTAARVSKSLPSPVPRAR